MFKRVIYDAWTAGIPIAAFSLTFGVFLIISIRAILMKKEEREQLATLPLEEDTHLSVNDHE